MDAATAALDEKYAVAVVAAFQAVLPPRVHGGFG
jgi:hypothetical protein